MAKNFFATHCISESRGMPTKCIIPYNNFDLVSKGSEDIATEITESQRFPPPQCRLIDVPSLGNPHEYPRKLYGPIAINLSPCPLATFVDSIDLSLFKFA